MAKPSDGPEISGIIKRAIDGDVEACGTLYSIYIDRIYRYVFYRLGDRMISEDVTEEVFIKAWKGIKACRGKEETFSAWLYRIAHNQTIDTLRRNHREVSFEGFDFTDDTNPAREAESVMEWQKVLEAVSALPETQKQIITLKFLSEADNNEIGRIMGKRQGAVRALQMRALDSHRCLVQIHLPRMEFNELTEIVEKGIKAAGMSIVQDATIQICTLALGLPHYVHALGLASGRSAIDNKRINIEVGDVTAAMSTLIKDTHQTILKNFDAATASPRRENLYFQVLLACALANTDHLGRFRAVDIRVPFSKIMERNYDIPAYIKHLHDLCNPERGAVLQQFGEIHTYRFRFANPVMQPFVIMQGLQRGLIGLPDIRPRNV